METWRSLAGPRGIAHGSRPLTMERTMGKSIASGLVQASDLLCFDIYAAARAITRAYRSPLSRLGLTYPQYLVMATLWESAPRSVKELGERLELDSGTLSPLLKRLEASGLVIRQRRADDRADRRYHPYAARARAGAGRRAGAGGDGCAHGYFRGRRAETADAPGEAEREPGTTARQPDSRGRVASRTTTTRDLGHGSAPSLPTPHICWRI